LEGIEEKVFIKIDGDLLKQYQKKMLIELLQRERLLQFNLFILNLVMNKFKSLNQMVLRLKLG
jgi:hypothetical protein